jgi:CheY-like chemotaxis protein
MSLTSFLTCADFEQWTRCILRQLYDSPALGSHPLASLLADDDAAPSDRAQNLRRIILECIDALRPRSGIPADSPDWRIYRILELRYRDGMTPDEAMHTLALQKSQFFRDQAHAWQALAGLLWERYQALQAQRPAADEAEKGAAEEGLLGSEAQRLMDQALWQEIDVGELIDELFSLVSPLAAQKGVVLRIRTGAIVRVGQGSRVPLRQAILNALTYALDLAVEGEVDVETFSEPTSMGVLVDVSYVGRAWVKESSDDQQSRQQLCAELMVAMGGCFERERPAPDRCLLRLRWPLAATPSLLVIDDNEGFLDLHRRYLAGHDWRVYGATSGAEAREVIAESRPTVILLDVLMPQEDGWDLLVALKGVEATRDIPVIVCSVLKEAQLALSLGAAAYLPKPVTEASLLQALAPWSRAAARASASQGLMC